MSIFVVKQKTAYEVRISDWSSDVCSSDLATGGADESAFSHLSPASATGNGRSYRRIAEAQSSAFHLCACLRDVCLGGTKPGDRCVEFLLADRLILQQRPIAINILLSIGCIGLRTFQRRLNVIKVRAHFPRINSKQRLSGTDRSDNGYGGSSLRRARSQSSACHLCSCWPDVCLDGTKPCDRCVEFLLADRLILQQRPIAINILLSIGCIGLRTFQRRLNGIKVRAQFPRINSKQRLSGTHVATLVIKPPLHNAIDPRTNLRSTGGLNTSRKLHYIGYRLRFDGYDFHLWRRGCGCGLV